MAWWCGVWQGQVPEGGTGGDMAGWVRVMRTQAQQQGAGGGLLFDGERWLLWRVGPALPAPGQQDQAGAPGAMPHDAYVAWACDTLPSQAWPWRCAFVDPAVLDETLAALEALAAGREGGGQRLAAQVLDALARHDAM